ncbi:ArfGap-domain-containing protein [Epithele typhae]|uniref:ArfGap-domain-containing protein n=1 Tax=Epithele typhae TaxID=378194 RepID=UPI0020089059|nr:ArfGap-domain-containing protein [Epithele typhae]KAH9939047.1 ArfGap-domain-containing protein [Epithele typhae]
MSTKQDRTTTERHAKTLRELLKLPDNKTCADCKRNDPRWASWNLGVFLCIRCSGVHRSMGTHISKVKSVDLDVWTPEQMASIQKWGNRRANAYWEAHLRQGHVPPDHKMDSYIRSKYESRRWAREGPPADDPSVYDGDAPAPVPTAAPTPAAPTHQARTPSVSSVSSPASAAVDLFSLDFHAPTNASPASTPAAAGQPQKDVRAEIMSLFSTAAPAQNAFAQQQQQQQQQPAQNAWAAQPQGQFGGMQMGGAAGMNMNMSGMGGMGGMQPQANVWGQQAQQQQPTSMMGNAGVGMWGASSGWTAPQQQQAQQQSNIWATPAPAGQANLLSTGDVWGMPTAGTAANGAAAQKKDDAFADIWGGFK